MRKSHLVGFLVLLTALWSSNLFAQATATGNIQGTVTDNSGALIVDSEVTVVSKATGSSRSTHTSQTGTFRFDLMPAGNYLVTTSKGGFAKSVTMLEVMVGQTARINPQ